MKNSKLLMIFGILAIVFTISCSSNSNQNENLQDSSSVLKDSNSTIDYSGVYKTSEESLCKMTLTITKEGSEYNYVILEDNLNYSGKILIEVADGNTYLAFDGQIGDNLPKTVSGQYVEDKIIIQNYGNSMNEYHYFKLCDEKYLEFKK